MVRFLTIESGVIGQDWLGIDINQQGLTDIKCILRGVIEECFVINEYRFDSLMMSYLVALFSPLDGQWG